MQDEIEIAEPPFFMTLLDQSGDTTITWSEADDIDVLTFIQQKIDAGYVFFIERPRAVRAFIRNKKITDVSEIRKRQLIVSDESASDLVLAGKIKVVRLQRDDDAAPVEKATSAKQVATSRSYAVRPLRGG